MANLPFSPLERRLLPDPSTPDIPLRRDEVTAMTRGDKQAYTDKQKRQAQHIEESEREAGRPEQDAERIAWATVNKQDGGGKKSGSGRGKDTKH